jgi:hypothetical protein
MAGHQDRSGVTCGSFSRFKGDSSAPRNHLRATPIGLMGRTRMLADTGEVGWLEKEEIRC